MADPTIRIKLAAIALMGQEADHESVSWPARSAFIRRDHLRSGTASKRLSSEIESPSPNPAGRYVNFTR